MNRDTRPVDLAPERRPGVPREQPPRKAEGAHWDEPEQQVPHGPVLMSKTRKELPPVYGTAQPPKGLSGVLRKLAYGIGEEKATHWLVLLVADRVDVLERRLATPLGVLAVFGSGFALGRALRPRLG